MRTQFGGGMKLRSKFLGPYEVVEKCGAASYRVKRIGEGEGPVNTYLSRRKRIRRAEL